jgi:hypothetical protein
MNALSRMVLGKLAGLAGTASLDAVTYLDMAIRGRPPSELPDKMVRKLAELAGCEEFAKPAEELDDRARQQRAGIAALLGYADGAGSGVLFGLVRPYIRGIPCFWAGIGLAGFTALMSEGLAAKLGQTDPSSWPASAWIEDIVPRCVYGWVTCYVFDSFAGANDG